MARVLGGLDEAERALVKAAKAAAKERARVARADGAARVARHRWSGERSAGMRGRNEGAAAAEAGARADLQLPPSSKRA
eukprot:CAMPEP_0170137860 /NCGR_PEP_ID=MMETSP0033_2-20121228/4486_1 /TAXON_ID=195969 /ORGANISM="Dolichomastix tenuilepis, Strain CCMP3274" /LENGTH=78 /DNA_ID=CAMNT_0010373789 /DNA_START=41 /DNA_END=274 /DNA_ORIENTATION=-